MDFQNRVGSKPGSGGVAGHSEGNVDRRERLRKLALETIDLAKDPYFMKNHLGSYECKLCLTLHTNEGSYLAHTQGKKHQTNLARRAARDARDTNYAGPSMMAASSFGGAGAGTGANAPLMAPKVKKVAIKIGRPGYKVTKVRDSVTGQLGLLFQIHYPQIAADAGKPRQRFMSAYEQRIEAPSRHFQYLLVAAEPYETIAFKVQSLEIDRSEGRFWTYWDPDSKQFHMQFFFKGDRGSGVAPAPASSAASTAAAAPPPSSSLVAAGGP
ncbi:hypothetical protein BC831DRAFT_516317 [Entophlyctis helioformis]|nr:hypothetical protein BC831DRAFT_516317 [Entophlyctis helioformis]